MVPVVFRNGSAHTVEQVVYKLFVCLVTAYLHLVHHDSVLLFFLLYFFEPFFFYHPSVAWLDNDGPILTPFEKVIRLDLLLLFIAFFTVVLAFVFLT